jgi:hypothetical protein
MGSRHVNKLKPARKGRRKLYADPMIGSTYRPIRATKGFGCEYWWTFKSLSRLFETSPFRRLPFFEDWPKYAVSRCLT